MSEPKATARTTQAVVPGVQWWHVDDERIGGFLGCSYSFDSDDGVVLIDPLPLAEDALRSLGRVAAIVLTAGSHQRSAWRLRRELGAPVWAPALSKEIDEEPDQRYGDGDRLPGDVEAHFTPGAGTTQHSLLRPGAPAVLFVPDLLIGSLGEELALIPAEYAHDAAQARESVAALLDLDFDVLCPGHGAPVTEDPKGAIRRALAG
jgi:glyoxylase-like metal-dependent hydrolase (beta-lactamase superfamily II)